jgi:hypothetical protein
MFRRNYSNERDPIILLNDAHFKEAVEAAVVT